MFLNAIVKRTELESSGVTDSVFLVGDSDADDIATFASALTSRYASEYEMGTASTAGEAHATLSVAGITVALLIVSREKTSKEGTKLLEWSCVDAETRDGGPRARDVAAIRLFVKIELIFLQRIERLLGRFERQRRHNVHATKALVRNGVRFARMRDGIAVFMQN